MTDIIQGLLRIAKQRLLHIMALFLITTLIAFLQVYQLQPMAGWFFINRIPPAMSWLFPLVSAFSGCLLLLNSMASLLKRVVNWKVSYISCKEAKIIKLFAQTGRESLRSYEIMKALGFNVHRFDDLAGKLVEKKYLETDCAECHPFGPAYWLNKRSRSFLKRRFLL